MKTWPWLLAFCSVCIVVAVVVLGGHEPQETATEEETVGLPEQHTVWEPYIQGIFIGQKDKHGSYRVAELEKGNLPEKPLQFAVHTDQAYVNIKVAVDQPLKMVESLFDQIQIMGNVKYSTTSKELSRGGYQLQLHFSEFSDPFSFRIGNLPNITLIRMEPLRVHVEPVGGEAPVLLLPGEIGDNLYVQQGLDEIRLRFSEPMVSPEQVGQAVPEWDGSWQDEQTLQINLQRLFGKPLNLQSLYSLSGNYLPHSFENVEVKQVPAREWMEYPSGRKSGFSRYDSFYDWLVYSPGGDKYVGLIDRGGSDGDGTGRLFTIILEQQGKQPEIVEPIFYGDVLTHGAPVQWLDNERIAYASYFGAYVWDAANGTKHKLIDHLYQSSDEAVLELSVDRWARKLYLLVFQARDAEDGAYQVAKWTYDADTLVRSHAEAYSEIFGLNHYKLVDLPIITRENGTYYTKADAANRRVQTTFVNRSGQSWSADGQVVWADHQGHAVLVKQEYNNTSDKPLYYWWEIGSKPRLLPAVNGPVQPFGPFVVSKDTMHPYKLDSKRKRWEALQLPKGEVHMPVQEERALYRRDK